MSRQDLTGREIWRPRVFHLESRGVTPLTDCGFQVPGHVHAVADVELHITGLERYDRFHIRINSDTCDPVILVRDPDGRWFYDDDSGTGSTASLSITNPHSGRYLVWAGSYQQGECQARLTLESF